MTRDSFFSDADFCWLVQRPACIPGVRDQKRTDCCYAFVITNVVYAECYLNGRNIELGSVQEFISCLHDYRPPKCMRNLKQPFTIPESGLPNTFPNAFDYLRDIGIYTEKAYPFLEKYIKFQEPVPEPGYRIFVKDYMKIYDTDDNAFHKKVIQNLHHLPLTGSILLCPSFKRWTADQGTYMGPTQPEMDAMEESKRKKIVAPFRFHAITIVGYGVEKGGQLYYLCQNSYGVQWGYKGYIKVDRAVVRSVYHPIHTYLKREKRKWVDNGGQSSGSKPVSKKSKIV